VTSGGATQVDLLDGAGASGPAQNELEILDRDRPMAGLQVGDRVMVPGRGLRFVAGGSSKQRGRRVVRRHVKNKRSDCPAGAGGGAVVDRWSAGKNPGE
jgi:hypothetical protein